MLWPPAVVVHGVDHACLALAAGREVTLLSGPGAAVYGGVGWWQAMMQAARAQCHGSATAAPACPDILDCADAPGAAMAALRRRQRALILDPACPAFAAVCEVAHARQATLLAARPPALDLAQLDLAHSGAARLLARWLDGDDSVLGLG